MLKVVLKLPLEHNTLTDFYFIGLVNNPIIASTRICRKFGAFDDAGIVSQITEDILNGALINVTLSPFNEFNFWITTTEATKSKLINVFAFSRQENLLVPYFVSLLVSLAFRVCLGLGIARTRG